MRNLGLYFWMHAPPEESPLLSTFWFDGVNGRSSTAGREVPKVHAWQEMLPMLPKQTELHRVTGTVWYTTSCIQGDDAGTMWYTTARFIPAGEGHWCGISKHLLRFKLGRLLQALLCY